MSSSPLRPSSFLWHVHAAKACWLEWAFLARLPSAVQPWQQFPALLETKDLELMSFLGHRSKSALGGFTTHSCWCTRQCATTSWQVHSNHHVCRHKQAGTKKAHCNCTGGGCAHASSNYCLIGKAKMKMRSLSSQCQRRLAF